VAGPGQLAPRNFRIAAKSENRPPAAFAKAWKRRAITPRSGLASPITRLWDLSERGGDPHRLDCANAAPEPATWALLESGPLPRRQLASPKPTKPIISIAQVEDSGTLPEKETSSGVNWPGERGVDAYSIQILSSSKVRDVRVSVLLGSLTTFEISGTPEKVRTKPPNPLGKPGPRAGIWVYKG
jgi:hypothetical protein